MGCVPSKQAPAEPQQPAPPARAVAPKHQDNQAYPLEKEAPPPSPADMATTLKAFAAPGRVQDDYVLGRALGAPGVPNQSASLSQAPRACPTPAHGRASRRRRIRGRAARAPRCKPAGGCGEGGHTARRDCAPGWQRHGRAPRGRGARADGCACPQIASGGTSMRAAATRARACRKGRCPFDAPRVPPPIGGQAIAAARRQRAPATLSGTYGPTAAGLAPLRNGHGPTAVARRRRAPAAAGRRPGLHVGQCMRGATHGQRAHRHSCWQLQLQQRQ
jgi:hypothetical protein